MRSEDDCSADISILLVEDDETARTSLGRMLSMKYPGITVYTAENGKNGLELYREHVPELVISDISMPQLNGIDMAKEIRAGDPRARIIFLSAHSETKYLHDAKEIGIPHYVLKPIDRHELFAAIGSCLEERLQSSTSY